MYLFMFSVLYVISCINMYCNVYLGYSRIIILFYDYLFLGFFFIVFFFFKQKPAYEVLIIDWSSDVCSSDLDLSDELGPQRGRDPAAARFDSADGEAPRGDPCELEPGRRVHHRPVACRRAGEGEVSGRLEDSKALPAHRSAASGLNQGQYQIGRAHV